MQKAELFDVRSEREQPAGDDEPAAVAEADVELAWLREQQKRRPA